MKARLPFKSAKIANSYYLLHAQKRIDVQKAFTNNRRHIGVFEFFFFISPLYVQA